MNEQLRIKNEGFNMKAAIGGITGIIILLIIAVIFREDLNEYGEEHRVRNRAYGIEEVEHDHCVYLKFPQSKEWVHKANCSNPEHKSEGK